MFLKIRTLSLFILLTVIASLAVHAQKAGSGTAKKPDPAAPVRAAFDKLLDGIRQVDVEKAMSVYDNSERTLFFNDNGTATIGWKTMYDLRKERYARTRNVTLDATGVRVEMLGPSAAYVSCKWTQSQEFDGKLENASGRMTLVFKLIGKEWKIVHAHTSPDNPPATRPVMPSERQKTDN